MGMTLQDQIYELFLLEKQVRGLNRRLEVATYQHTQMQTKLNRLETQHAELSSQLKHTQAHASTLEHQARDVEIRIEALREQMATVTNNKEYSALLIEVNTLKLSKGKIEEEALVQMEQVESLQKQLAELDTQVAQQKKLVSVAEGEVQSRKTEVGAELAERTAKRDEAASGIAPDIKNAFDRLCDQHDGEALAPAVEDNAKRMEYSCGGCYMTIPLERVNSLFTQPNTLTTCPSCQRFLYVDDVLREQMDARVARNQKS
jgi:predicted  nucleic acid-binding Zn-ribbon protein